MSNDKLPLIGSPKNVKQIKIDGDEYDVIRSEIVTATKMVQDMYIRLGRPQTPFSSSGAKMVSIVISVWEDLYPLQAKMWFEDRREYQKNELTTREQVYKHTGRSLASFPLPIYNMMKKIFPKVNLGDRDTCIKMVKKWPMFRMANRV